VNLANLVTEAERLAGRVDSLFFSRVRRWINEAQEQWATEQPWPQLLREESFTTNGTRSLMLPPRVRTVLWAADQTNQRPLDLMKHWDREFPAAFFGNTLGAAQVIRQMGISAVSRQPATVGPLTFNTLSSDSFSVYVAGLALDTNASGSAEGLYYARETVPIASDGTYTSTTLFSRIDTLGKDDFTPADIQVRDGASNLLARIPRDSYQTQYRQLDLLFIPPAGTQIAVQYLTVPEPLVDNAQVPHSSVDPEYLIWYAAGLIHEAQSEVQQSQIKLARAKEILNRRIHKEKNFGDQDWRALPETGYWNDEDQYIAGNRFGG
jgi:hypothetical protein